MRKGKISPISGSEIFNEIHSLIEESRREVSVSVNAVMTMLYWQIGKRINQEILGNKRAEYGQQVVEKLSSQLTEEYGKGWSKRQLHHCLRFAETFPHEEIVNAVSTQLS